MYNIPTPPPPSDPNTHRHTHAFSAIQCWPPTQQETHTRTHTAYYLYEVLYTSGHQHRVSLFSNPHSSWKDCSLQWRDYTIGLIGLLIWVIVGAFDNKNRCRKEYHCFYMILLNVLQLYISATAYTAVTHMLCTCVCVSVLLLSDSKWEYRSFMIVKATITIKTTTVQLHYLEALLPLHLPFLLV